MDIRPIRTDADYRTALKEVETLMTAEFGTPEGDKLDILVTLIEAYEQQHYLLDPPDPVEAIKFEMEQKGLTVRDLEPMIGKSNRVYEILNRKRFLTLKMIQRLHHDLGIPAESLIKQPWLATLCAKRCTKSLATSSEQKMLSVCFNPLT